MPPSDIQHSSELPVLQVVAVESLVVHEHTDPVRNESLVQRLQKDGLLRNPPIVAPIPGSTKYVILDGANRATALAQIGCRDAVVQVIDYSNPELELLAWNHLISVASPDEIMTALCQVTGVRVQHANPETAHRLLAKGEALAFIVPVRGEPVLLRGDRELEVKAELLNGIVGCYHGRLSYARVKSNDLESLLPYYDGSAALVVFPIFQPEDIIRLVSAGGKLPAGITRHVIPQRALRLDIPISVLQQDQPLAEKNEWLRDEIKMRLRNRQVRYYQEPIVLFDE